MADYADRMFGLLPEIYGTQDRDGDLRAFLSVVGLTLDGLDSKIGRVPALASLADCPPEFLGYLAALVAAEYDPKANPIPQRRWIREAIERHRRTGTVAALELELRRLNWAGEIVEAFRRVMRLNYRAKLNHQKLPGRKYNHGIYGITEPLEESHAFNEIVARHQPAGTIVWIGEESITP